MSPVAMAERGVHLSSIADLNRFADMVAQSEAYSQWKDKVAIAVAVQTGMELGFSPVQSLRSLYVAKDGARPQLYGEAALGLMSVGAEPVHEHQVGACAANLVAEMQVTHSLLHVISPGTRFGSALSGPERGPGHLGRRTEQENRRDAFPCEPRESSGSLSGCAVWW